MGVIAVINKKYIWIVSAVILSICFILVGIFVRKEKIIYYNDVEEKTEIRLLSDWYAIDKTGAALQNLISEFNNKNTDVFVTNDVQNKEEYYSRLKLDFASENEPDVFISWPGTLMGKYAESGKIACLNEYLKEDENWYESFDKSVWNQVSYNGKIYALPIENCYTAMFVNMDILNECSLKIPTTFEELKASIPVLRSYGYIPFAMDISETGLLLYKAIAAKLGGKFYSDFLQKDGVLNENYVRAGEYVQILYELGAFPDNLFSITENERDMMFMEKKAAFIVQESHFLNSLYEFDAKNYNSVQICFMPYFNDDKAAEKSALYGLSRNTIHVSQRAMDDPQKKEKILRFLKYMTSEDTAMFLKKELGAITASYPNKYDNDCSIAKNNALFVYSLSETVAPLNYSVDTDIWSKIVEKIPNFLTRGMDIYTLLGSVLE